jgi:hypothetical protein
MIRLNVSSKLRIGPLTDGQNTQYTLLEDTRSQNIHRQGPPSQQKMRRVESGLIASERLSPISNAPSFFCTRTSVKSSFSSQHRRRADLKLGEGPNRTSTCPAFPALPCVVFYMCNAQIRTVPSALAEARWVPSGDQATS